MAIKYLTNFLGQTFAAAEEVHSAQQIKYCMGVRFVIKD